MLARAIVERYAVDHDPSAIADDAVMVDHGTGETVVGADAIGSRLHELYSVFFPGAEAKVRNLAATEDIVTLEMTFSGRNDGPFLGRPPTGRQVEVPMCIVYRIGNGKIAEIAVYWNTATMMEQLGVGG